MKRLTRSSRNKMILGVCGGIGDYLSIDPTIIRIIWVLFAFTGAGVLAYFLCGIIIPLDENVDDTNERYNSEFYDEYYRKNQTNSRKSDRTSGSDGWFDGN